MKTYLIDSKKGTMKLVPNAKKSGSPSRTRSASVENDSKSSKHRINPRSSDEELPAAREPSPSPHVKTPKDYTTLGQVFDPSGGTTAASADNADAPNDRPPISNNNQDSFQSVEKKYFGNAEGFPVGDEPTPSSCDTTHETHATVGQGLDPSGGTSAAAGP
ncbi:hypothetical protein MMC10_010505 [Thelotrema lepadinum]|nr:hypothetical protein [Thelotrema lepadinum]